MGPFLVSLEEILSNERGGPKGTQVTCEGSGAGMAELVSFAFVLAKKPRRAKTKGFEEQSNHSKALTNEYMQKAVDPNEHLHE